MLALNVAAKCHQTPAAGMPANDSILWSFLPGVVRVTLVWPAMRRETNPPFPNMAAPSPMPPYCVGRHHPSIVKPPARSEFGRTFPHEMPSLPLVRGTFTAAPIRPDATERLSVRRVPSKPFGDESAGSAEFMCQTPL